MPQHTTAGRSRNTNTDAPLIQKAATPAARAGNKLFGSMMSPPSSFKTPTPSVLATPDMGSVTDRPKFKTGE